MTERQADITGDNHGDKTRRKSRKPRKTAGARAMLGVYDDDADALKAAEPCLFENERTSKLWAARPDFPTRAQAQMRARR